MSPKRIIGLVLFLLSVLFPVSSEPGRQNPPLQDFFTRFINNLEARSLADYLNFFSSDIHDLERARFKSAFEDLGMESVKAYLNSIQQENEREATAYVRVVFRNAYSVILELWRLQVEIGESGPQITSREVVGDSRRLFRLSLPSQRIERVSEFEIRHEDIVLSFQDALVFYDNIPDLETALLVIGVGKLLFTPSHPREQHQLELIYKYRFLEDRISYAYLRFSNSFFHTHVKMTPAGVDSLPITESEVNKAYSLFAKHYTRSFTVRSSINDEFLSLIPQGNEAVFEFEGDKIGDVTYVYSPFSDDEINFYQWKQERILSLYSPPVEEGGKRLFISFGQKFDVEDYVIELDFNPREHHFAGKAVISFKSKIERLDALKFRLNSDLEILRINDSEKRKLYFAQDKLRQLFYVYLLDRPNREEDDSIEVFFRGNIDPPQIITDTLALEQDDRVVRFTPRNYDTLLYSRSSFWYPAPSENDYFTARLQIVIPPGYQAVSNGQVLTRRQLRELEDLEDVDKLGHSVYVFETRKPVKYLSFLVGKLTVMNEQSDPFPLCYYRSMQTQLDHWDVFDAARDILNYYQDLFGPFPYEKLSIVKRLWPVYGGHSPASFIVINELPRVMGRNIQPKLDSPVNLSRWKEYFLAHEIAHQWWGQGLAWENYSDQWLSEGLAQFAAVSYIRRKYGEKDYLRIIERFNKEINKNSIWGGITMGSRISHFNFKAYQTIIYNKPTVVLMMLQEMIGREAFRQGLQRFFSRFQYASAATGHFRQVFKDIGERDLNPFFDLWFNSYLLPDLRASYSMKKNGPEYLVSFHFQQLQNTFMFPLWIEWKEGRQKLRRMVIIDDNHVWDEFTTRSKPKNFKLNPDHTVPGKFVIQ